MDSTAFQFQSLLPKPPNVRPHLPPRWPLQAPPLRAAHPLRAVDVISSSTSNGGMSGVPVDSSASPSSSSTDSSFDNFDYAAHWYPVAFVCDLPLKEPIKVTLFDVDYVIARTTVPRKNKEEEEEETIIALRNECPHKKAPLSEGRISDCGALVQCAYHGWSFDGRSGECVEIPQVAIARDGKGTKVEKDGSSSSGSGGGGSDMRRRREDATAVAATVEQGVVWLHPWKSPLEALAATASGELLPPPRVPEIDLPGFKTCSAVRDFPIDWTVLLENIMDPDHGMFAHSSGPTAAKGFDLYAADGVGNLMTTEEEVTNDGKGWTITSRVNAVPKLIRYNEEVRLGKGVSKKKKKEEEEKQATTVFSAPSLVYMGRRDGKGESQFMTAFWVCPVGTGRSRFMSSAVSKVAVPRWLLHLNINNFLDQDTYLLTGQQRAVLAAEAERAAAIETMDTTTANDAPPTTTTKIPPGARKATYVYRSPSEKLGIRIGRFFDATLPRVPNRLAALRDAGPPDRMRRQPLPPRSVVLDRYEQHTKICPDSLGLVRKCERMELGSGVVIAAVALLKVWSLLQVGADLRVAVRMRSILGSGACYAVVAVAAVVNRLAKRVRGEFFFRHDESARTKAVKLVTNIWRDPEVK